MDEWTWFKERQKVFAIPERCNCLQVFEECEEVLQLQFEIRVVLRDHIQEKPNEVYDTMLFYLDMQIEDFQSILSLARQGFFSSPTRLLRSLLLSVARIVYLRLNPSKCKDLRRGIGPKDKELMGLLKTHDIQTEEGFYPMLCESTHLNLQWEFDAKQTHFLNSLNEKSYLYSESLVLSAQKIVLVSCQLLITVLNRLTESKDAASKLVDRVNCLTSEYKSRHEDFDSRMASFFRDIQSERSGIGS